MKIDIVEINSEGDGVTALYIDGSLHTYGDYYHDKIEDWSTGFLDGLEYAKIAFTLVHWDFSGDTRIGRDVCEMGNSPPSRFSGYPQRQLKKY